MPDLDVRGERRGRRLSRCAAGPGRRRRRTLNATPETILAARDRHARRPSSSCTSAGLPVEIETIVALARRAGHRGRRGRGPRVSEPDRRAGGPLCRHVRDGRARSPSTPPRRSRPARAGCSSPTTTRSPTGPGSCRCTASAATPGSATRRADPGTTRSRTPGFKYNMTDIAAALGLVQLERAEELLAARRGLAAAVHASSSAAAASADLLELPEDARRRVARLAPVRRPPAPRPARDRPSRGRSSASRRAGIGTSVHFIPLHLHPYYRGAGATRGDSLPTASREYERVVSLPLWPGMTPEDVRRVTGFARRRARRGSPRLARLSPGRLRRSGPGSEDRGASTGGRGTRRPGEASRAGSRPR